MDIGYVCSPEPEKRKEGSRILRQGGCDKVFIDEQPVKAREQLIEAIEDLMEGDRFIVLTLAEIGNNSTEIIERCFLIESKNVRVVALDSKSAGRNINYLYRYLKKTTVSRQKSRKAGRKPDKYLFSRIISLHITGFSAKEIAKRLNVPSPTVYRYLSDYKSGYYQDIM